MWVRRVVSAALAAGVVGSMLIAGSPAASAATSKSTKVAPGLTYTRITDPSGPWIIHVLRIDPARAVAVDPVTASSSGGGYARTSTMGSRAGALAAVNGDFAMYPGFPLHTFVEDGALRRMTVPPGLAFGVRADETDATVGYAPVQVWAKNSATGKGLGVAAWNDTAPGTNQVVGYTGFGGARVTPPRDACSVRLRPIAPSSWRRGSDGVVRDYSVDAMACGSASMAVTTGTTVLSSRLSGTGATWIKGLTRGQTVRLSWSMGLPGVLDVISSNPLVLDDGVVVGAGSSCRTYLCQRHPRTAVGVTATDQVLLVVVDGRKSTSVGMRLDELGRLMKSLGAVDAMNLDGGGSSTMWIAGKGVVNDPTDSSGERSVASAIVVLPGPDPAERFPRARLASGAVPRFDEKLSAIEEYERRSADLAALDPASTGGLVDWMLATGQASRASLPPALLRVVDRFRSVR